MDDVRGHVRTVVVVKKMTSNAPEMTADVHAGRRRRALRRSVLTSGIPCSLVLLAVAFTASPGSSLFAVAGLGSTLLSGATVIAWRALGAGEAGPRDARVGRLFVAATSVVFATVIATVIVSALTSPLLG